LTDLLQSNKSLVEVEKKGDGTNGQVPTVEKKQQGGRRLDEGFLKEKILGSDRGIYKIRRISGQSRNSPDKHQKRSGEGGKRVKAPNSHARVSERPWVARLVTHAVSQRRV